MYNSRLNWHIINLVRSLRNKKPHLPCKDVKKYSGAIIPTYFGAHLKYVLLSKACFVSNVFQERSRNPQETTNIIPKTAQEGWSWEQDLDVKKKGLCAIQKCIRVWIKVVLNKNQDSQ